MGKGKYYKEVTDRERGRTMKWSKKGGRETRGGKYKSEAQKREREGREGREDNLLVGIEVKE